MVAALKLGYIFILTKKGVRDGLAPEASEGVAHAQASQLMMLSEIACDESSSLASLNNVHTRFVSCAHASPRSRLLACLHSQKFGSKVFDDSTLEVRDAIFFRLFSMNTSSMLSS